MRRDRKKHRKHSTVLTPTLRGESYGSIFDTLVIQAVNDGVVTTGRQCLHCSLARFPMSPSQF